MKLPLSLGLTLSDRYTVAQMISQEQSERVYLVEDEVDGGRILLMREFFSDRNSIFQEIQMLLQTQLLPLLGFSHPHLQQFYETFFQNEGLYLVEAYFDKNANVLSSNRISENTIIALLGQILTAVEHLHQRNICHRNICSSSIFQLPNTEHFVLKDFGVFQNIRSLLGVPTLPKYGDLVKQASGAVFYSDQDLDLYSLAVTAVSLLTGKSLTELFDPYTKVCIWERYESVSDRLANVLNKMLAVDPNARFNSAADALHALSGNSQFSNAFSLPIAPPIPRFTEFKPPLQVGKTTPYNGYEQNYNSPEPNHWQTGVADPALRSQGNHKWLFGAGIVGSVMLLAIATVLTTRNSQPQVVSTPTPQPTIIVSVPPQPTVIVTVTPQPTPQQTRTSATQPTPNAIATSPIEPVPTNSPLPKTKEEQIDDIADQLFAEKYPQLGGRKLQPSEKALQAEWSQIRRCDAVVDYIFYQRYPSMKDRKIGQDQTSLRNEWWSIRDTVSGCN